MLFAVNLHIPKPDDERFEVRLDPGEVLFVIGANGSGKSALIDRLSQLQVLRPLVRVRAHRQTWFESAEIGPGPREIYQRQNSFLAFDVAKDARYKDPQPFWRVDATLSAISEATHRAEHRLWEDIHGGMTVASDDARFAEPPLGKINRLFRDAKLNVQVELNGSNYTARRGPGSFGANAMSDGERAAFLIAGDVLTAAPGSWLLIDEPERHLHRAISSPLLSGLFRARKDCAFVVSTHDLDLPLDNPSAQVLVLRACTFQGLQATSWDFDLLPSNADLPEGTRRRILGCRRNILFVEGTHASLDLPLYRVLFPEASVVPAGGCSEVEAAVAGLRAQDSLHSVKACGIVDSDFRDEGEVDGLRNRWVYPLGVHSIESVYYSAAMQQAVAGRLAAAAGIDGAARSAAASTAALSVLESSVRHLAECKAKALVLKQAIAAAHSMDATKFPVPADVVAQCERDLADLVDRGDLDRITAGYPIKETGIRKAIADSLGVNTELYESTVLAVLNDRAAEWQEMRGRFSQLLGEFDSTHASAAAL